MTTEELIALCEAAVVPVENWRDRDSAGSQKMVGKALALLRSGCEWEHVEPKSDPNIIWIRISYPGFNAFEYGREDRGYWDKDTFYIPTASRLAETEGSDWY